MLTLLGSLLLFVIGAFAVLRPRTVLEGMSEGLFPDRRWTRWEIAVVRVIGAGLMVAAVWLVVVRM